MRRLKDKLCDNGGVTILMALFALLLASVVCIVILGVSVTSVKQAKTDQQHEQDMLLVQSAAELIGNNLRDHRVKVTYNTEEALDDAGNVTGTSTSRPEVTTGSCLIEQELEDAAAALVANPDADYVLPDASKPSIVLTGPSAAEEAALSLQADDVGGSVVEVAMTLRHGGQAETGKDYQLVFTFDLKRSGKTVQTMYASLQGELQQGTPTTDDSDPAKVVRTTPCTFSWSDVTYYLPGEGVM